LFDSYQKYMTRGGYRPNAGRKKGFSTLESEKAREFIVRRVNESIGPIIDSLVERGKNGDLGAIKELFDRAYGKAVQSTEISGKDASPIVFMPLELMKKHGLGNV
jgi:hypothetical protein